MHIDTKDRSVIDLCTHCYRALKHLTDKERNIKRVGSFYYDELKDVYTHISGITIGRLSLEQYFTSWL